ncbi:MAG: DUF2490 domain-containing protein [Flavobacteriaceae bacterium]|nr:DUF2490 domain-containing protein [Flavobacteriaceae bacterium]
MRIRYICTLSYKHKVFLTYLFFVLVFLSFSKNVSGQSSETAATSSVNQQLWIDIFPHFYVNEKLEYYGDGGYRTIISKESWNRIYARPSIKYHLNHRWTVHSGLGLFYIWDKPAIDRFEVTPWQGIEFNWPTLAKFSLQHLAKIEERLSFETDDWTSSFELRFRYKLSGKIDLLNNNWFIPFYGEYFLPIQNSINETFRNKGRLGVGLGRKVIKEWQLTFMFNWQSSRTGPNDDLGISDYAYQLKIKKYWRYKLQKKLKAKLEEQRKLKQH